MERSGESLASGMIPPIRVRVRVRVRRA